MCTVAIKQRTTAVAVLAVAITLSTGVAQAATYVPPPGKVFAGVGPRDPSYYDGQTQSQPAVLAEYIGWYGSYGWFLHRADLYHALAMFNLMPNQGKREVITPGQIMGGRGDEWLFQLGRVLAQRGRPTYVRIMAEMNGYWNPYCAFTHSGRPRPDHSTSDFKQAWRRIVLILRGGSVQELNARLRRLHMRQVEVAANTLPSAPVAFIWNPQTFGDPRIPANSATSYYPGNDYVDWVGTDFFSLYPYWSALNWFYGLDAQWQKPFAFGEWGIWDGDNPTFANEFFAWMRSHRRVRMLVYYQSYTPHGHFDLGKFRRSRTVIRRTLNSRTFAQPPSQWLG